MANNDFNVNNEYDVVYDGDKKKKNKSFFNKIMNSKNNSNGPAVNGSDLAGGTLYNIDDANNQETSRDFPEANSDFNYNNNIVFEEKANLTTVDKIKEFISTVNKTALLAIGGVVLGVIIILIIVFSSIAKENNAYEASIDVPNLVYMGETSDILINSKYTGKKTPKKNVNDTVTTFEIKDAKVLSVLEQKVEGSDVMNAIVPVQEGRSNIKVTSKLNGKTLKEVNQEVVVCPAFTASLVQTKQVYIVKGTEHQLKIDFGEEECSKGITYESSNESVATIDDEGTIDAIATGQTIITIKKGIKEITFSATVTDKYVGLNSIKVIPSVIQLSEGEKYRLKIDYEPINATSFNPSYRSNNESIVKVSSGGLVEALSEGTTTVKVTGSYSYNAEVKVVVTKRNTEDSFATAMQLDKNEITLVQGKSEKITATLTPESVSNKAVTWTSKDEKVATVNSSGIVYGKGAGNTLITASTSNGITKTVKVTVNKMKKPTISTSDGISSNIWHTKPYVMTFKSSETGIVYYYGTSESDMNDTGNKLTITKDENQTYYVKACMVSCTQKCTNRKDKNGRVETDRNGNPVQTCKTTCSKKPSVCSDTVSYTSKFDMTKPQAVKVAGIEITPVKTDTVQIAFKDGMSLVQKWCVTTINSYASCRWTTIQTNANPVVNYTAKANGTYYAFAKDAAGNISEALKFEITNIE